MREREFLNVPGCVPKCFSECQNSKQRKGTRYLKIMGLLLWFYSMLVAAVWVCEWKSNFELKKKLWKKKTALTISVHSHVHPSSK